MNTYDVTVVGGGIAGSVAAQFAARAGLKTLLIEKLKTPRNKACSGIQFPYLERLVGRRAPREVLCRNELLKVEMVTPGGRVVRGRMRMLNFWRSTFDSWLNSLAGNAGAEFCDEARLTGFRVEDLGIEVRVAAKNGERSLRTRYLIGADGLNSGVRRSLRPTDSKGKASGALNYYFAGAADLDPNTLYMFYSREFSPLMFAWVYKKDDWWVVGTGADKNLLDYARRLLKYVQEKYALRGELVKKEGFSSPLEFSVYLGQGMVLLAGDAAGLVDLYRGLGMDNAALSGRLAVKAILESESTGCAPILAYQRLMRRVVHKTAENARRQAARYATDEALNRSLSYPNLMKDGLLMLSAAQLNKVLPAERTIMLPL